MIISEEDEEEEEKEEEDGDDFERMSDCMSVKLTELEENIDLKNYSVFCTDIRKINIE